MRTPMMGLEEAFRFFGGVPEGLLFDQTEGGHRERRPARRRSPGRERGVPALCRLLGPSGPGLPSLPGLDQGQRGAAHPPLRSPERKESLLRHALRAHRQPGRGPDRRQAPAASATTATGCGTTPNSTGYFTLPLRRGRKIHRGERRAAGRRRRAEARHPRPGGTFPVATSGTFSIAIDTGARQTPSAPEPETRGHPEPRTAVNAPTRLDGSRRNQGFFVRRSRPRPVCPGGCDRIAGTGQPRELRALAGQRRAF